MPDSSETGQGLTCRAGVRNRFERIKDSGCLVSEEMFFFPPGKLSALLHTPVCQSYIKNQVQMDAGKLEERLEGFILSADDFHCSGKGRLIHS